MISSPSCQHPFPLLKQDLSGYKEQVETDVTLADNRKRTDINTEEKSWPHDTINASVFAGTTWKSSVKAVQLNVNGYYQSWN